MSVFSKFQTPVFNICVGVLGSDDIFDFDRIDIIRTILSSKNIFSTNPIVIEADPFLFVKNDTLHLFYEEQRGNRGKGIIKMTSTQDLKTWTKDVVVLEESYHLSYPNVFKYGNKFLMLPETGHNGTIQLYEMSDDLKSCRLFKTLLHGENFVDSTIFRQDNINYLVTSIYKGNSQYEARIYIGDENLDNWKLHPQSPFSAESENARCGGAIIVDKGSYYRIAQDCSGNYGGGLNAMKIDEITPSTYKEFISYSILPNRIHSNGGHHYSLVEFNGKKIAAIDYLTKNIYIKDIIDRILPKFIGIKH